MNVSEPEEIAQPKVDKIQGAGQTAPIEQTAASGEDLKPSEERQSGQSIEQIQPGLVGSALEAAPQVETPVVAASEVSLVQEAPAQTVAGQQNPSIPRPVSASIPPGRPAVDNMVSLEQAQQVKQAEEIKKSSKPVMIVVILLLVMVFAGLIYLVVFHRDLIGF